MPNPTLVEEEQPKFVSKEDWLQFYMAMDAVDGKPANTIPQVLEYLTERGIVFTDKHGTIALGVQIDGVFMRMAHYLGQNGYTFKRHFHKTDDEKVD